MSVSRSFSTVQSRTAFFLAIDSTNYFLPEEGAVITDRMLDSDFIEQTHGAPGISTSIYKDLGKTIVTTTASGLSYATYRLVQRQLGGGSEGVPATEYDNGVFYIRTWSADPVASPVTVVRIG
jgi:hypothetical protein